MKGKNFRWVMELLVAAVVTALGSGVAAWYSNREKVTSLDIEQVNASLLTRSLTVEGLVVKYQYHDSIEVENLWKTVYVIKNTGENTLYGNGFSERNTRNGVIPLYMSRYDKLLDIRVVNGVDVVLNEKRELVVEQWKPGEYVEIEVLSEGDSVPILTINERGIQNATVTYSQYSPIEKATAVRLIDCLPRSLGKVLKWSSIVVILLFVVMLISQIPSQIRENTRSMKIFIVIAFVTLIICFLCPLLWMF